MAQEAILAGNGSKPKSKKRICGTLKGDWVSMWEDEARRGGDSGEVMMRIMTAAKARDFQHARHEIYGQLQTIKASMEILRLQLQNAELLADVVAADKAADRIRTILGNVSNVSPA